MSKKTVVISLFGGPGSGKSTSAAYIFSLFKNKGYVAELVQEYVKTWAWEGRKIDTYDQILFAGKQVKAESRLFGVVDLIVTDSPVWLSAFYAHRHCPPVLYQGVEALVRSFYSQSEIDGHTHIPVFMNRSKPYVPKGRYETEEQAVEIDGEMRKFLTDRGIKYLEVNSNFPNLEILCEYLIKEEKIQQNDC